MLHRNKTVYAKLRPAYRTKRLEEAKATISLNVVVPKELEKETEKFIKSCLKDFKKAFEDFIDYQDGED